VPIYEYQVRDGNAGCEACRNSFETMQAVSEQPLVNCPKCGAPVMRLISPAAVGSSKSGFDSRAKNAGFHKLVKRDKGVYEKQY